MPVNHVFIRRDENFTDGYGRYVGPLFVVFDRIRPITHVVTDDIVIARNAANATGLVVADTTGEQ